MLFLKRPPSGSDPHQDTSILTTTFEQSKLHFNEKPDTDHQHKRPRFLKRLLQREGTTCVAVVSHQDLCTLLATTNDNILSHPIGGATSRLLTLTKSIINDDDMKFTLIPHSSCRFMWSDHSHLNMIVRKGATIILGY